MKYSEEDFLKYAEGWKEVSNILVGRLAPDDWDIFVDLRDKYLDIYREKIGHEIQSS